MMRPILVFLQLLAIIHLARGLSAVCNFSGDLRGNVVIEELENGHSRFSGTISPLSPGLHGFHVHEYGDLGDNCKAAGGHFNPFDFNHGGPEAIERHVGDLGNIYAEWDDEQAAVFDFEDDTALLGGPNSIIGKAIVVHAGEDDLGLGGDEGSITTGNAGTRLGCCIITEMEK